MNWFKMLPNASLRAPLQPGRWFTKGIRREPETMELGHEKRHPMPNEKGDKLIPFKQICPLFPMKSSSANPNV